MNTKKKALIFTSVAFAVAALAFLLIGGWMAGWDIIGFFSSTKAYILYAMIAVYAIMVGTIIVWDWVNKR